MLRLIIVVVLPILLVVPSAAEDLTALVLHVKDGDSFVVNITSYNIEQINECKMLHYNAPELNERVSGGVPNGLESAQKLADLIEHRKVRISTRRSRATRNVLCDVWLTDGTHVNEVMRDYLSSYNGRDKYLHLENR